MQRHEKVNYERLMKNFKEKEIYSQRLEPPMVVTVSMTEAEALTRYKDAFAGLGFTIESLEGMNIVSGKFQPISMGSGKETYLWNF